MSEAKILKHDPLSESDKILTEEYYGRKEEKRSPERGTGRKKKAKPTHYKVVCISLYTKDIQFLEEKVAELKERGYTKANKSQLIRYALAQLDIDKLPPPNP